MGEVAYVNGQIVPLSEAKVSILDRGFLYGDGLFETIRVYNHIPFLLDEHLRRMQSAAKNLKINMPDYEELVLVATNLVAHSKIKNGILKIVLTRGIGERGLSFTEKLKSTLVAVVTDGIFYTEDMYERGFSAVFTTETRGFGYLKSLNFLANVVARSHADNCGAQEAFFIRDGLVTEGTMSNVFMVKKGVISTPSLQHSILPGITRKYVLDLAKAQNIDTCETDLAEEEFKKADEIFITNSILEVMPVVKLEGERVGNGISGRITKHLRGLYCQSTPGK